MSTYTVSTAATDNTSAATFKNFCQPISDALSSGHFNWTPSFSGSSVGGSGGSGASITWASVTSVATSAGNLWEVWAMNDGSNQTACPFFMRFDYWNDGSNSHLKIAIGTGCDGSGNITGGNGETYDVSSNNNTGVTYTDYFSGTTGSFRMQLFTDFVSNGIFFVCERSKDSTGADTTSYVSFGILGPSIISRFGILPATGTFLTAQLRWPVPYYEFTTATFGTNVAVFPILPCSTTVGAPMLGASVVKYADVSSQNNASITVTAYGASHTYKIMNNAANRRAMYDPLDCSVLMQYE
jgi:hypothetical protein